MFLANYSGGLSDLPLPDMIACFQNQPEAAACFIGITPTSSFPVVQVNGDGSVRSIGHIKEAGMRMNRGFLRPSEADLRLHGWSDELVQRPFQRLAAERKLLAYKYDRFWACMDTFREKAVARGHGLARSSPLGGLEVASERREGDALAETRHQQHSLE